MRPPWTPRCHHMLGLCPTWWPFLGTALLLEWRKWPNRPSTPPNFRLRAFGSWVFLLLSSRRRIWKKAGGGSCLGVNPWEVAWGPRMRCSPQRLSSLLPTDSSPRRRSQSVCSSQNWPLGAPTAGGCALPALLPLPTGQAEEVRRGQGMSSERSLEAGGLTSERGEGRRASPAQGSLVGPRIIETTGSWIRG